MVSFAAKVSAMYSASVDDGATEICFFEHQLIGSLFIVKIRLKVDFLSTLSSVQSVSEYPTMLRFPL